MRQYLAVIADLIGSRGIRNRGQLQKRLEETLERVNHSYKARMASPFTITLGDEFQGLLYSDAPVFQILDEIEHALHPQAARFGIGLGTMSTAIDPESSLGADGQAYWHARAAIDRVHDHDDYGMTRTCFLGLTPARDAVANSVLALGDAMKRGLSQVQRETFGYLLKQGIYQPGFDQRAAAQGLHITPEALYKRLKLSGIKTYLRSRAALHGLISEETGSHA